MNYCCSSRSISWSRNTESPIDAEYGDTLQFVYVPGLNNVYWMPDKQAYDDCDFSDARIISAFPFMFFLPPVYFPLTDVMEVQVGDTLYFASGYLNNCEQDNKIEVHVIERA